MSRDHDAPLEYLRILASLKLRFGLAALATARGTLPVAYPIEEQGHSPTQWLNWSSSFPMNVTGRQAEVHSGSASIPRQSARCFVSLIGDLPTGAEQWWRRSIHPQIPRPFHRFGNLTNLPDADAVQDRLRLVVQPCMPAASTFVNASWRPPTPHAVLVAFQQSGPLQLCHSPGRSRLRQFG